MARPVQLIYYTPPIVQENTAHQRQDRLAVGHHVGFHQPGGKRQAGHAKDSRFVLAGMKAQEPQFIAERPLTIGARTTSDTSAWGTDSLCWLCHK